MDAPDLVISVGTSAANLTGAMGRPLWLMLPSLGDWRWHLEREDSPWFPSARRFREQGSGWPEVVERIRLALIELRHSRWGPPARTKKCITPVAGALRD